MIRGGQTQNSMQTSFSASVAAFGREHGKASQSISALVGVGERLLNIDHIPKLDHCKKLRTYCDHVSSEILRAGSKISPEELFDILNACKTDMQEACYAIAGPHISMIAALKNSANTLLKGKKMSTSQTNRLLSTALQGVNAINSAWRFVQQSPLLIFSIAKLVGPDTPTGRKFKALHGFYHDSVVCAQSFSEGARMKVAEETFQVKLTIPSKKKFKGLTRDAIFAAGPCIRSEVVFRHKGKAISKVPKAQPMRMTVFGHILVLTSSTLDAETLVIPPTMVSAVEVIVDDSLPKEVFHIRIHSNVDIYFRSKTPGQCEGWIQFFLNTARESTRLLKVHSQFRDNLLAAERIRSSSPVPLKDNSDDTNLSLLTHRAYHPATRKPANAWGGQSDAAVSRSEDIQLQFGDEANTQSQRPAENEDLYDDVLAQEESDRAYAEITARFSTNAKISSSQAEAEQESEDESGYIEIGPQTDDLLDAFSVSAEPSESVSASPAPADDPWTPRATSPAGIQPYSTNTTVTPIGKSKLTSFQGIIAPPPVNARVSMNPRPETKFAVDFDSIQAQKALGGVPARRIPVQPLVQSPSSFGRMDSNA